ncbi:MAG: single-stranded DNA-binding protein [Saprospiraceae bacterium]|nr:single-stranded DNA-binding protein [Saprospiraceae bacterium]
MKFNKIRLLGHLGKDPISFKSKNDLLIVRFSIATNEGYGSHKKKKTLWHEIVAFGKTAELALKLLKKGSKVFLEGKLNYNVYEDKDGKKRSKACIILEQFLLIHSKKE